MSEAKKNDVIVQGSFLAIAGLITRFIGLIYRLPLTRIVGSEGMTYYNTAYEIYNLALLLSTYSIPVAVSKLVSAKDALHQYHNSNKIVKCALMLSGSLGFVMSLGLFIFAKPLAGFMGWPSAAIPLRVLAPTIFIFSLMGIIRGFFQGKRTMVPTGLSQVIEQIFNAITSIVAALLLIRAFKDSTQVSAYGAAGGTTGTLVGAIFGLIFLCFVLKLNLPFFKKQEAKDLTGEDDSTSDILKALILTMLPIILSQTIYQLSGIIDNYMFGNIMDSKGIEESSRAFLYEAYSNKYKWLYNLPVAVASAFGVSVVPMLAGCYNKGDLTTVKHKIASTVKINMIIAIPSAVGLSVLAKPILVLLFNNPDDNLSHNLMTLGGIAVVFFALSTLTNGVLQGINHMRLPVIHAGISLVIHIVIVYLLVAVFDFGAYGLVIGNVSYGLLVCILNWHSIDSILDYKQEIKTTFIIPLLASCIMGCFAFAVYKLLYLITKINSVSVIPALIIAVLVYFCSLLLLKGVNEEELLEFPKGKLIVKFAHKMKLL